MGELWLNGRNYSGGGVEITGEASGTIASFEDGSAKPLKSLVVDINPVQEGSGTPSPSNPRPISGWEGANVVVSGINSWDEDWELGTLDAQGNNYATTTNIRSKNYLPVKHDEKYYISSPQRLTLRYYDINKVYLQSTDKNGIGDVNNSAITIPSNCYYIRFAVYSAYGNEYNDDISINYPSTDTEYHAHVGTIYPISWQTEAGEVYGGKLNVTTGELTVDRAFAELDGSSDENWMMGSSSGHYRAYIVIDDIESYSGAYSSISQLYVCSIFENGSWNNVSAGNPNAGMTGQNWGFGLDSFSITTDTELREWLSNNNIQIAYKLATPLATIQLTPTEVDSLLGSNNIWADTGDSDVVYVRDIDKAFNILWNAVMNSNSGTRSLNLMKGAISETKEDIEEPIKEEEETKEGNDENQR